MSRLDSLSFRCRFAVTSGVLVVVIGTALGAVLSDMIEDRAHANAERTGVMAVNLAIAPVLRPGDLEQPIQGELRERLNQTVAAVGRDAFSKDSGRDRPLRVKIFNSTGTVVYSDFPGLVGKTYASPDLQTALAGAVLSKTTRFEDPDETQDSELGTALEVYVPLDLGGDTPPGVAEIYLPYEPVEAAMKYDRQLVYLMLGGGLLLFYVVMFRMVSVTSRRLARGHAQTQLLYRFVDRTSSAQSLLETLEIVVVEAADLMHAKHAYLVEVLDDRHVRCHALREGSLHTVSLVLHESMPWWWTASDTGLVQYQGHGPGHGEVSKADVGSALLSTPRDGLAAPLRGAGATRYVLVVCDRSIQEETFGKEDVQVFEALAAHAGVAVERARSVSDLEASAESLKIARDAAVAASEAKSIFLANMSHEIRTPLTTVIAAGELLDDASLNESQLKLLGRMHRSGRLLLSLVERLLDFSRLEAGHVALQHQEFDLHAVVAEIDETHRPSARQRGTTFELVVDPQVPQIVTGDRTMVVQVLNNLVDNALKFTVDGQVKLDVRAVGEGGSAVLFTVWDTGIGIDRNNLNLIFEAFEQVDGSATRHYEGTGLGLAICKQLTALMGGTISVDSQLGVGSTFTVRLPLSAVVSAPTPMQTSCNPLPA